MRSNSSYRSFENRQNAPTNDALIHGAQNLAFSVPPKHGQLAAAGLSAGSGEVQLGLGITWLITLISLIALGIAGYLSYFGFTASAVAGCGGSVFDCTHVLTSKWSKIFGIPVSAPAFAIYLCLLVSAWAPRFVASERKRSFALFVLLTCSFTAAAAGIWFICIQVFSVEHLCPYCLGAHSCGLALAGIMLWKQPLGAKSTMFAGSLALFSVAILAVTQTFVKPADSFDIEKWDDVNSKPEATFEAPFDAPADATFEAPFEAPSDSGDTTPEQDRLFEAPPFGADIDTQAQAMYRIDRIEARRLSSSRGFKAGSNRQGNRSNSRGYLMATLFSGLKSNSMLLTSVDGNPLRKTVTEAESQTAPSSEVQQDNSEQTDEAKSKQDEAPRIVSLRGGSIQLNAAHWPMVGNPKARYILVEMFDYTCAHCRETHNAVKGAKDAMGEDLAVILLPVPMNSACNKYNAADHAVHAEACDLAKLAVAVWRIDPAKLSEFHNWMFEGTRAPSKADAATKAQELVGKDKLDVELSKDIVNQYIERHSELYNRVGKGVIPKLIFPRSTVVGKYTSANALIEMIKREAK
ncbi:MAG TPA: vitamin K epoxide reductase family protein [Pirellulaceae bacterium]|nr:vitamin K epoxide reductase family protein [Pirellulaceae bacterium]HMO91881.1 vitamin K epoxide reductase family protein [Pirellulaceae bacterium]HMP69709.1 vitamin K epoxide reductase family protein [Pirellulaceae bacterium]